MLVFVTLELVALLLEFAVHEPEATSPHFTTPSVPEVSVPQLMVAYEPTTSVRKG
jgi:hypothetical protein